MDEVKELTVFIEKYFNLYECNTTWLYAYMDDDTNKIIEHPLFPNGIVEDRILDEISLHLGMTKAEILAMDENAATRYWNKYPFFALYHEYLNLWKWHIRQTEPGDSHLNILLSVMLNGADEPAALREYNPEDIRARLVCQLKEIDQVIPGTFHSEAEITDLVIQTEVLFSFRECREMITSFLSMVDRTKELFFKAVNSTLSDVEIRELNFLACWLGASDVVMPSTTITYENICTYREVYREENLSDFYSYVKFRRFNYGSAESDYKFVPWRCKEFFDDVDLAQRFIDVFPPAKTEIREFAMLATNYYCDFVWSDAKPIVFSAERERELQEFLRDIGEKDIPLERRAKEHTRIYVKKTSAELFDWGEQVKKLNKAASPAAQGGLLLPERQYDLTTGVKSIERLQERFKVRARRR